MGADDFRDFKNLAAAASMLNTKDFEALREQAKQAAEMVEAMRGGPLEQAIRDAAAGQEAIVGPLKQAALGAAAFQDAFTRSATAVAEQVETMRATHTAMVGDQSIKAMQQSAVAVSQLAKDFGMGRYLEAFDRIESARAAAVRVVEANASALASAVERTQLAFAQPQWDLSSSIAGLRSQLEAAARVRAEIFSGEELRSTMAAYVDSMSAVTSHFAALAWPVTLKVDELQRQALEDMRSVLEQYRRLPEQLKSLIPTEDSLADRAITTPDEPLPPGILELPVRESIITPGRTFATGMLELSAARSDLALGYYEDAVHHGSEAAACLPEHPEPHVVLGTALNMLGRFDESLAALADAEERGADSSSRADARTVYEASLQRRRWDGQVVEEDDKPKN